MQVKTTLRYRIGQNGRRLPTCCADAENPGHVAGVNLGWCSPSGKRRGGLCFFPIEVQLVYNILISGVQHHDSNILLLILQPQCPRS